MKKAEVKIGGRYWAKVTNRKVEIRIDAEKPRGGWEATNLATGKKIQIKSAQRLQGEVTGRKGRMKVTTDGDVSAVENQPAAATVGAAESTQATKKPRTAKSQATEGTKKLSAIDAAARVLSETGTAMNAKELVDAMAQKKLWSSPGGKTPHATLYSAILREISTKGGESRFQKTERGKFAVTG